MEISPGVKRQLKISAWIIVAYCVALLIYLRKDVQNAAMMGGASDQASETAPYSELTWEVLVVDPELRNKLWARFDHSPEEEKEKAYLAVVHMMDSLSPDQAEHLSKNFLERSGGASDRNHRKKLLEMLERLGAKFISAMASIAHFSAKAIGSPLESQPRKKDVQDMMDNIARETKDTGYKYCLKGGENEVKRCAERLVEEGHQNSKEHLKKFLDQSTASEEKGAVLIVIAKNQLDFGKEYIPGLLLSNNAYEIKIGLRLVREYELVDYRREVEKLRSSKFESVVEDVNQTLSYLATRRPAQR